MISIAPTHDLKSVNRSFRNWGWERARFDGCVEREKFTFATQIEDPLHTFLAVTNEGLDCGFVHLIERAPFEAEPHACLAPECRGKHALAVGRLVDAYARSKGYRTLSSYCPAWQREAVWISVAAGYRVTGRKKDQLFRDGKFWDIIFYTKTL